MARKRKTLVERYPKEFRRMAVEKLKRCDNIVALSQELGMRRRLLYKWRDPMDPAETGGITASELKGRDSAQRGQST